MLQFRRLEGPMQRFLRSGLWHLADRILPFDYRIDSMALDWSVESASSSEYPPPEKSLLNCHLMQARDEGVAQYQHGFSVINCRSSYHSAFGDSSMSLKRGFTLPSWCCKAHESSDSASNMSPFVRLQCFLISGWSCFLIISFGRLSHKSSLTREICRMELASKLFLCRW